MPTDPKQLPPHLQAQIASAGQALAENQVKVENVNPNSGPPTDWQNTPGQPNMPPVPQQVEPVQPEPPAQESPER